MKLIREYENESLDTICHIVRTQEKTSSDIAIDEQNLAWMFVGPEYSDSPCCEKLLEWVYDLLAEDAWMILQTSGTLSDHLLTQFDLDVIENYRSESHYDHAIDLLLVRKTS